MEDPCAVYITCRMADVDAICTILNDSEGAIFPDIKTEICPGVIRLELCAMDYAAYDEITEIASKGIAFHGSHGAGATYPAGVFASDGNQFIVCNTIEGAERPVIEFLANETLEPEQARDAYVYWELFRQAREMIGEVTPAVIS